jgi:hypothetical protein
MLEWLFSSKFLVRNIFQTRFGIFFCKYNFLRHIGWYLILYFYNLVMSFQSLGTRFLKGPHKKGIQIYNDSHLFYIIMRTSRHILWYAINKHEKKEKKAHEIIWPFFVP